MLHFSPGGNAVLRPGGTGPFPFGHASFFSGQSRAVTTAPAGACSLGPTAIGSVVKPSQIRTQASFGHALALAVLRSRASYPSSDFAPKRPSAALRDAAQCYRQPKERKR